MSQNLQNFVKFQKFQLENLVDFEKCCKTTYFLAKIGADTAENEQHLAEISVHQARRDAAPESPMPAAAERPAEREGTKRKRNVNIRI